MLQALFGSKGFENISITDYMEDFDGVDHTLIDVRTASEFREGHMPGTINIPLNEIGRRTDEIPTNRPVVLVCATGNRSGAAARQLAGAGREHLYNLTGGISAWARAGHPVER
ncbi:MAG: rhodanese-like domain-containing protein [Anaerolineae bacterium]